MMMCWAKKIFLKDDKRQLSALLTETLVAAGITLVCDSRLTRLGFSVAIRYPEICVSSRAHRLTNRPLTWHVTKTDKRLLIALRLISVQVNVSKVFLRWRESKVKLIFDEPTPLDYSSADGGPSSSETMVKLTLISVNIKHLQSPINNLNFKRRI